MSAQPAAAADRLEAALEYAWLGLYVLPLIPGTKRPPFKTGEGHADQASRDWERLDEWFAKTEWDVGLVLHLSRHAAVDVDVKNGGPGAGNLRRLERDVGVRLSDLTATQISPSGGWHYLFGLPDGVEKQDLRGQYAAGVELQQHILAAAPSTRSGKAYRWVRHPRDGIATLDGELLAKARRPRRAPRVIVPGAELPSDAASAIGASRLRVHTRRLARATAGRHNLVLSAAYEAALLHREGLIGRGAAEHLIRVAAEECGEITDYGSDEVDRWIDDGWAMGLGGAA